MENPTLTEALKELRASGVAEADAALEAGVRGPINKQLVANIVAALLTQIRDQRLADKFIDLLINYLHDPSKPVVLTADGCEGIDPIRLVQLLSLLRLLIGL